MAQGHSGINPADPGPPSLGRLLWALHHNVDRMLVKNRDGAEQEVLGKILTWRKRKLCLDNHVEQDWAWTSVQTIRLLYIQGLAYCFYQEGKVFG